jgi:hypothetical protein
MVPTASESGNMVAFRNSDVQLSDYSTTEAVRYVKSVRF